MIRDLRALTQAGMKDCKDALVETNWDLDKAVDVIKAKGKLVSVGSRAASEGVVGISRVGNHVVMVEVNSVTDFVAKMPEFQRFVDVCLDSLCNAANSNAMWSVDLVESQRQELLSMTKENIVVRRWWVETMFKENTAIFSYVHTNEKIGAILTVLAPSKEAASNQEFIELANNLVLQIAAMNPLAISPYKLSPDVVNRQKAIFQTQLNEMNKPEAAHEKIMLGKMNKWYTEVCLLNQESVTSPKVSVGDLVSNLGLKLGGEIQLINFIRCQVGEGIDKPVDNFADEAAQMAEEHVEPVYRTMNKDAY